MIVSAVDILGALNVENTSPYDFSALTSLAELGQLVAFSMLHCAAVERVFTDQQLFSNITSVAVSIPHVVSVCCKCMTLVAINHFLTEPDNYLD